MSIVLYSATASLFVASVEQRRLFGHMKNYAFTQRQTANLIFQKYDLPLYFGNFWLNY
jgi:hypothetical protein